MILFGGVFIAGQFDLANPGAGAFAGAFAIAVAGVFAVAYAGAGAGVVAFGIAFTSVLTGTITVTIAGAVAVTGAVALIIFEGIFGLRPIFRILYLLLILFLVSVLILLLPKFAITDKAPPTYLVLFLVTFPTFNALADFTSTGLTRYLLRRGLTKPVWFNTLLDTIGGVLVFLLLGFALISYIHLIRPQDGIPLLDLAALFDQLQNNRSDFWWLAIMLGSTLLPTLLHLMVGVATILIQYPKTLCDWTITKLVSGGNGSDTDGWQGSAMVCAMTAASIWLPIVLFYYLLTVNHGAVVNGTIWLFYSYADLIGAL